MSLHWYACIFTNTYCFETYHISLETNWWALSNASSTVRICSAVHEIFADKAFTATDGLISQSFVIAFVHLTYMQIVLIWGYPAQLSLWKSVHWLWRHKLNEVCDILTRKADSRKGERKYIPNLLFLTRKERLSFSSNIWKNDGNKMIASLWRFIKVW